MWLAVDSDGERWLYDTKPEWYTFNWWNEGWDASSFKLDKVKPPAHPEKSLKKVTVTISEA